MTIPGVIALVLLAAGLVCALAIPISTLLVLNRLEKHHPAIIHHFDTSWGSTSAHLRRFIWSSAYESHGDPLLVRRVDRARFATIFCLLFLFAAGVIHLVQVIRT